MSLQARTALNLIAGALAGFLGWAVIDLPPWFSSILNNSVQVVPGSSYFWELLVLGAVYGLFVGLLLGVVDALAFDSDQQRLRAIIIGGLIGAGGGLIGVLFGQIAYSLIAPANAGTLEMNRHPGSYLQTMLARSIGWGVLGGILGAAQGVSRWSGRIAVQGLFGGVVGGLIGGVAFEALQGVLATPVLDRFAGFVVLGAAIGFFIGLVQNIFKQAWIRVVVGRNEGKEYLIAKSVTTIGRSELADIGLFGDKAIAPTHIVIEAAGDRYRLRALAAEEPAPAGQAWAPVVVNGMPVAEEIWLADGDTIAVAGRTLQFRERVTQGAPSPAAGAAPASGSPSAERPPTPVPPDAPLRPIPAAAYTESYRPPLRPEEAGVVARPSAAPVPSELVGTHLACLDGPYAGQSFPLGSRVVSLGRANDRDIALPGDEALSRLHATIDSAAGRHTVQDEGSANGTYLNEVRLAPREPHPLRVGDYIRIGRTIMRYE